MIRLKLENWKNAFEQQKEAYPIFTSVYLKCSHGKPKNKYYAVWSNFINNFENGRLFAYQPNKPIFEKGDMIMKELLLGGKGYYREMNIVYNEINDAISLCLQARAKETASLDDWWAKTQNALSHAGNILFPFDLALESFLKELQESNKNGSDFINRQIKNNRPSFLDDASKMLLLLDKKNRHDFDKAFSDFVEKFGWFQNTYKGPFKIDRGWLKKYLKEIKRKKNPRRVIEKNNQALPDKYKIIVSLANEAIIFRDDKKKLLLLAVDLLDMWLRNLCKQNKWEYKVMRWLTVDEILEIAKKNKKSNAIMAKRCSRKKQRIGIMTSKGYDNIDKKLWEEVQNFYTYNNNVQEIKGTIANKGKCLGKTKIITDPRREANKFMKGDILVASNTRPEFIALMNRASAFVTDEGGMSCHAAIVAREMKKPCIIGTKIATKVLHDGDLVEVDANKGMVKILKRKK